MIALMPIFSQPNWPIVLLNRSQKTQKKKLEKHEKKANHSKTSSKQKLTVVIIFIYFILQLFLPFSHWITKGYNTWTNGLYGYSWDMMVHKWKHIHTKITVVDKTKENRFYLDPELWTKSVRWNHHVDMVKQFANCAAERLKSEYNISEPEIYIDVWTSLNSRFAQRIYDPSIDIVQADWSPFHKPNWVLPLLFDPKSEWQKRLISLEESIYKQNNQSIVVSLADFPGNRFVVKVIKVIFINYFQGLSLKNYIDNDLDNTTLSILKGVVKVEYENRVRILHENDTMELPSGKYHKIFVIQSEPAYYMYTHVNRTSIEAKELNIEAINTKNISFMKRPVIICINFAKFWREFFNAWTIG